MRRRAGIVIFGSFFKAMNSPEVTGLFPSLVA
jgi:hypothetical protein